MSRHGAIGFVASPGRFQAGDRAFRWLQQKARPLMSLDRFRTALAIDDDPARAADRVAEDLIAQGGGGSVGFVYVTDRLSSGLDAIVATLAQKTGVAIGSGRSASAS